MLRSQKRVLFGGRAGSSLGLEWSARPSHRSDVSTCTHRPYRSVYSDLPQALPPEGLGFQRSVSPLVQWLFNDLIFFSSINLLTWLSPISIPVIYANKVCHYFHLCQCLFFVV